MELSDFEKRMIAAYRPKISEKREEDLLLISILGAEENGIEGYLLRFTEEHPAATIDELTNYFCSLIPPMEIVDDEELDEDDQ